MDNQMLDVHIQAELDLIPRKTASQRVLEVSVKAPPAVRLAARPRLNLALVLDRSGSMSGEKLNYVKRAAQHVLDLLEQNDRVAVVTYDDQVNLLAPSTEINDEVRFEYRQRIGRIQTGGYTNLSGGWLQGCQEVAGAATTGQINRTLLLTDGFANYGITDPEILNEHARNLSLRGVSTSTFGVGEGFNEHLLEGISNQGSGNFYYIGSPAEIPSIFEREFTELAQVTARGVKVEIELPPGVDAQIPGDWRTDRAGGRLSVFLGDLNGGRQVTVYLKLSLPPMTAAGQLDFQVKVHALDGQSQPMESQMHTSFRYADQTTVTSAKPNRELMERFVKVEMAEATNTALKLERRGEIDKARQVVLASMELNEPFMDKIDKQTYHDLTERMQHGMDESDRKTSHYDSYNRRRGRGN